MSEKNKTAYFQWLRLMASAAVVWMHTVSKGWSGGDCTTAQWQSLTILDSLVRWPVPVFVMITGALFLPRKTTWETIFSRYIPRMLIAFVVWSGLNVCYQYTRNPASGILHPFASGQYHLWYLPFLCGVYLILPFLQKIAEDNRLAGQLTVLALVFGCAVPWLMDLGALLVPEHGPFFAAIRGHLNYAFFLDLLAALMLGHWLHSRELPRRHRLVLYALGLISLAGTMAPTLRLSVLRETPVTLFLEHSSPLNICTAAAIFVFAKQNLSHLPKLVGWMADRSFGVYLCHALVIDILADWGYHAMVLDPIRSVPVLAVAVFAISLAISAILGRIPVIGKYLA